MGRVGYRAVQAGALLLDRLHRVEGDAWNFLMVARKPFQPSVGDDRCFGHAHRMGTEEGS